MKKIIFISLSLILLFVFGCKQDEPKFMPAIPLDIDFNQTQYQNGDSLYGNVTLDLSQAVSGIKIEKIDCRLGNIVIGESKNTTTCKFGVRLEDKPIGKHIFSVIVKCDAPDYDQTYLRYDYEIVDIVRGQTNR